MEINISWLQNIIFNLLAQLRSEILVKFSHYTILMKIYLRSFELSCISEELRDIIKYLWICKPWKPHWKENGKTILALRISGLRLPTPKGWRGVVAWAINPSQILRGTGEQVLFLVIQLYCGSKKDRWISLICLLYLFK